MNTKELIKIEEGNELFRWACKKPLRLAVFLVMVMKAY
jgi:hypothetical protein